MENSMKKLIVVMMIIFIDYMYAEGSDDESRDAVFQNSQFDEEESYDAEYYHKLFHDTQPGEIEFNDTQFSYPQHWELQPSDPGPSDPEPSDPEPSYTQPSSPENYEADNYEAESYIIEPSHLNYSSQDVKALEDCQHTIEFELGRKHPRAILTHAFEFKTLCDLTSDFSKNYLRFLTENVIPSAEIQLPWKFCGNSVSNPEEHALCLSQLENHGFVQTDRKGIFQHAVLNKKKAYFSTHGRTQYDGNIYVKSYYYHLKGKGTLTPYGIMAVRRWCIDHISRLR